MTNGFFKSLQKFPGSGHTLKKIATGSIKTQSCYHMLHVYLVWMPKTLNHFWQHEITERNKVLLKYNLYVCQKTEIILSTYILMGSFKNEASSTLSYVATQYRLYRYRRQKTSHQSSGPVKRCQELPFSYVVAVRG